MDTSTFTTAITNGCLTVVSAAVAFLIGYLIKFLSKKIGVENLKIIEESASAEDAQTAVVTSITKMAIKAVEQKFSDAANTYKLNTATTIISGILKEKGLDVSSDTIDTFIHSLLKEAKAEFFKDCDDVTSSAAGSAASAVIMTTDTTPVTPAVTDTANAAPATQEQTTGNNA